MAPILTFPSVQQLVPPPWPELSKRGLGAQLQPQSPFTLQQVTVQQCFAVATSSISLVAGMVSLYWFVRMRRMFRHHLIMLLIIADLFKALWYFVFPVIMFGRNRGLQDSPRLCNASGFLLSCGIEAADYSSLVIATHASLSIFSTKTSRGETGLYNYRYYVYAGWFIIPLIMASLAFVNPEAPYVSQGTFCYLPVRPYWYRLALSWIPRYVILIAIATMSLSIYLYVRHEFKSLDASSTTNSYSMPQGRARFARNGDSQSFQCDGMFSMTSSIPTMVGTATPNMSNRTAVEDSGPEQGGMGSQAPVWENYTFGSQAPAPMPTKAEIESEDMNAALQESRDRSMALNRANVSGDEAGAVVQALDETQPATPLDGNVSSNRLELVDSNDRPLVQARLKVRHKTIQRQLRYLFVYPIIYMLIWIVPFIQHCRLYSDTYSAKPSFALSLLSTIILALQCTVDSIVFTIREKPWRHIDYGDDTTPLTFKQSLKPRFKRHRRPPSTFSARSGGSGPSRRASYRPPQQSGTLSVLRLPSPVARSTAGMSRSERLAEARAARRRREVEVVAAKADRDAIRLERKKSMARRHGAGRSWWEVEGRQRKDSIMLGTNHSDLNMPRKRTLSRSSSNSLGAHLGPVDETPREGPRIFRSQTDHSEIAFETSPRGIIRISTEKEGNVFVGEEGASEASQSAGSSATRASGAKSTGYDGRA